MKKIKIFLITMLVALMHLSVNAQSLEQSFRNPMRAVKSSAYRFTLPIKK